MTGYEELRDSPRARLACAALILFHCHSLGAWHADNAAMLSTYGLDTGNVLPTAAVAAVGGPLFPGAFETLLLLALLYFAGFLGLLHLVRRDCRLSVAVLALLTASKAYFYLSDARLESEVHHLHLGLSLLFLASPAKRFAYGLGVALSWVLLGLSQAEPSWLRGDFYLSIRGTSPFVPDVGRAGALLSAAWVLWQILGPALWFSRSRAARGACLAVFSAACLYRAGQEGLDFPLFMLPAMLIAFWGSPEHRPHLGPRGWAPVVFLFLAGAFTLPRTQRNVAGSTRIELEKHGRRLVFEVEWPWRRPTLLADGATAPAGTPAYRGAVYAGAALVERLPWNATVREGDRLLLNPYALLTVPSHAIERAVRFHAERLCREHRPDRLGVRLELRFDGDRRRTLPLDHADHCRQPGT
ncbi:MAG: hypothetical protein HY553_03370 [Elusimicrobia bacterium]|nr:hypothetical protein [Elusimicrobiota bacterium]